MDASVYMSYVWTVFGLYLAVFGCIWAQAIHIVYGYVCMCADCIRTVYRVHAALTLVCALYIDCMPPRDLYMDCIGFVWTLHGPCVVIYGMYGLCGLRMDYIRTVYGCMMIDKIALCRNRSSIIPQAFVVASPFYRL